MQEAIIQMILETEKTGDSPGQRQVQAEAPKNNFLSVIVWAGIKRCGIVSAVVLGGMLVLAGCSGPEVKLERQVDALRRSLLANHKTAQDYQLVEPIQYDIRKTDSLISPLEGQIEYKVTYNDTGSQLWLARRLTFAYQHRAWVLVQVQRKMLYLPHDLGWQDANLIPAEWQLYGDK
jgi:hypothetical protein